MARLPSILKGLQREFPKENIGIDDLDPVSTWFSYGSNLYAPDFEAKMKRYGSNLSLLCAQRCVLHGFERKLDNRSMTRGLAYALHRLGQDHSGNAPIEGVAHDVPIANLPAFLRFEGVLNEHYEVRKDRSYDITRAEPRICKRGAD